MYSKALVIKSGLANSFRLSRDALQKLCLTLAFILTSFWLTTPSAYASEIRVGVVLDQSSVNADLGRDYLAGARTWFDHLNRQGGINGRKITVIVRDDEGQPDKAVTAVRDLIETERVDVLFGAVGDDPVSAIASSAFFRQAGVALYAPLSGFEVSPQRDNIFYLRPTYRDEVRHVAKHFTQLGSSRFVVVASSNAFGAAISTLAADELNQLKLGTAVRFTFDPSGKDAAQVAAQVAKSDAAVVLVAADTLSLAEFLKRFRKIDKGTNVVGFSTVNHRTLLEFAKPEFAAGTMLTQVVPHPDLPLTRVQSEHISLMALYRDEPPSHLTLEGFIAAKSFASSIAKGSLGRAGILASLSASRRVDVGGIYLTFTPSDDRGSKFVDLAFLRRSGRLVQ
jgi:branched-chain amino acid transport system substrate-binding protein